MHAYTLKGEPRHTVPTKDGGERPTRISDMRANGWLYSYTTVKDSVLKNPGVENWGRKKVYEATAKLYGESGSPPDYGDVESLAFAESNSALDLGGNIHAYMEAAAHGEPGDPLFAPYCAPALQWLTELVSLDEAVPEFRWGVKELGTGGTVDLHIPGIIMLDYKTQNWKGESKPAFYPDWTMQLGLYHEAMRWYARAPFTRGVWAVCISTDQPGKFAVKKYSDSELAVGLEKFNCLLNYLCLDKGYDPRVES